MISCFTYDHVWHVVRNNKWLGPTSICSTQAPKRSKTSTIGDYTTCTLDGHITPIDLNIINSLSVGNYRIYVDNDVEHCPIGGTKLKRGEGWGGGRFYDKSKKCWRINKKQSNVKKTIDTCEDLMNALINPGGKKSSWHKLSMNNLKGKS